MVGHRPCLHELAVYLLTGDPGGVDMKIKKGGVVCIEFDDGPKAGAGTLRWLFTPKVLRSLVRVAYQHATPYGLRFQPLSTAGAEPPFRR